MWIFTKHGFFSAACVCQGNGKLGQPADPDRIMVRAKVQSHLKALKVRFDDLIGDCEIQESPRTDHAFRMFVPKSAWVQMLAELAEETDYDNFKSEVAHHQGNAGVQYGRSLHNVWSVMNRLQWREQTLAIKAEDKARRDPLNVLRGDQEQMPAWLLTADEFRPDDFFSSRVVYYPGSGTDGQAFKLFCRTHCVHCVLHIDLSTSASDIQLELAPDHPHHLKGYTPCVQHVLAPAETAALLALNPELCPDGQDPVVSSALWTVLERQQDFGDEHGPQRIAFLHIQAEAVWVCRSVWGALDRCPFAVIVQDHGFSDNWTTFGGGRSPLYQLQGGHSQPKWLLVGKNTRPWPTYHAAADPVPRVNGRYQQRTLFRREMKSE